MFHNDQATLSYDLSHKADCTLSTADFKKLITGNLKSTTAFMFGKLKVDGSIGQALKLEKLLKEYVFDEEKIV
ncbi:SCP2 sterol-binding domain-containing protein [Psychrobacillus sp. NPDC096623]|uniref:SCP2 sterol-binding domain-containing protein n=1 Tax=Psychrobacillus sp. NPDC096623 TaxID=3364492 RepID=UPI00380184A0